MKHPVKALGLLALALCAAWTTACQSKKSKPAMHAAATTQEQIFQEVDADSDGRIDQEEFTRYFYAVSYDHHDVDGNDKLYLVEWVGTSPEMEHQTLFAEMDGDGSGWLVLEEYSSHPVRTITVTNAFVTIDRNGDEYVEMDELEN